MIQLIKKLITDTINIWTESDIYAISLYVYDDCDNPCKPCVTLGYNTERQVRLELSKGEAFDEAEARWNYAFWLQNDPLVFGIGETAKTVRNWVVSSGFPYYDDDDTAWQDDNAIENTSQITETFVSVLIESVKEIHKQGVLTRKFGRELPIIIHELEYYDEIVKQNIKANGYETVKDFSEWCINS